MTRNQSKPSELDFVSEYAASENDIYRYILTLVPHRPDADELMQETARTLWTKYFDTPEPIRSFRAWAYKIAFYEVLRYRDKRARDRLSFSTEVVEQLAGARLQYEDSLLERRQALGHCLKSLAKTDCELLQLRYGIGQSGSKGPVQSITNAMSKRLQRVRKLLMKCIEQRTAMGSEAS